MIKAVIFDCFGVLASDGWLPFRQQYFSHDKVLDAKVGHLNDLVDSGRMPYEEFIPAVAELAGVPAEQAFNEIESNLPNQPLFDFIAGSLKQRYRLGMLSNAGDNWLSEMFTSRQVALFDAIALSYETGVIKPQPQAYRLIAERLSVQPEECIFIDDQPRYCQGALSVGMQAINYESTEQTVAVLSALGI